MPETLINSYHKFALCVPVGGEEVLDYDELRSDYRDGYYRSLLFGSAAGLRRWKYPFDALIQFGASYTFRGRDYNKAEYIRSLFSYQKTTGTPFVIESPVNGQYYLALFDETANSLQKKLTAEWTTNINLKQVRLKNTSVFDYTEVSGIWGRYYAQSFNTLYGLEDTDPLIDTSWNDETANDNDLGITIGGTYLTNQQNSLPVVRLNGTSGFFARAEAAVIYEAFFVMRINAAALTDFGGILTDNATVDALVTNNSGTIAYNFNFTNYEYRKDSILHAQSAQELPMNEFGLVHVRFQDGISLASVQIGKQKNLSKFLAGDLGEIVLCDALLAETDAKEITEDLMLRWDI